jgi:hypothetical protein
MLHVMFGGSWATSRCVIKTLHQEVAAVALVPKAAPHHKWVETPIGFYSSDYLKSMVGVSQLPLLVSPTISNVKLYHILIDGGAALNLISLAAFKKLQIPMGKLQSSRPFFGVGPVLVTPCGCISLPVTFEMAENFHTESVLFDVADVSLPFNAILGRLALYQFMTVAHYGYLVLKMPPPMASLRSGGTVARGFCAGEAPGPSSSSQSYRGAWGLGSRTIKLVLARLDLSTSCAILWQGRRPHEDHPGQD